MATAGRLPSGIRELINLLKDYETPEADTWREALLRLWMQGYSRSTRVDVVAYLCGQVPRQGERIAWMAVEQPHPSYTLTRNLEGLEFQFEDLNGLITAIYRPE